MRLKRPKYYNSYKPEPQWILKLKLLLRDFREREGFYFTHSRQATYIDPELLQIIYEAITESKAMIRASRKCMSTRRKGFGESTHENNRGVHQQRTANIARYVGKMLGLNEKLLEIMAIGHDLGHTSDGHEGERQLKNILENNQLGTISHNVLLYFVLVIDENILEIIKEKAKKRLKHLSLEQSEKQMEMVKRIIYDMICHNGETAGRSFGYDPTITNEGIQQAIIDIIAIPGKLEQLVPSTAEGRLLRPIDILSYIGQDYIDGCRRELIEPKDPDYLEIFKRFGVSQEEIDEKHDGDFKIWIVNRIEEIAKQDLINNSSNRKAAGFSEEIWDTIKAFRDLNYRLICNRSSNKFITEILPTLKEELVKRLKNALIESNGLKQSSVNTSNYSEAITKFLHKMRIYAPHMHFIKKIVEAAVKNSGQKIEELSEEEMNDKLAIFLSVIYCAGYTDESIIRTLLNEGILREGTKEWEEYEKHQKGESDQSDSPALMKTKRRQEEEARGGEHTDSNLLEGRRSCYQATREILEKLRATFLRAKTKTK